MSLLVPVLLLLATLWLALKGREKKPVVLEILREDPLESAGQLESQLEDLHHNRERVRRKALLRGEIIELKSVQVICEKGHQHKFLRFARGVGNGQAHSSFDSRNLAHFDHEGNYNGPAVFGRTPGEGLGWVQSSFGCPTCDSQRFSFAQFEHNEYTTCGNHLVRRDVEECPICAELARSSAEEWRLLSLLRKAQFPQRKAS